MKIIGIDLGTSNTYIYASKTAPRENSFDPEPPAPLILPEISDDHGSIATVVLYERDEPFLAGNIAESEFYANLAQKPQRRLASQFKPEIAARQPEAMRAMTDFLRFILKALPEGVIEADTGIYVGMPSLSRDDFGLNMAHCFEEAGWPRPLFVRESDAALVSCLQSGVLDIDDIENTCLILDFGGGTFDYTTVESMDVLQNGGDLLYGGRLFDDLFFQVFCRHDKKFAKEVPSSPYEWYVHWIECKKQKENFSDSVRLQLESGGKDEGFSLHAVWYDENGARQDSFVHDYTREQFIRDAENYRASARMLDVLAGYRERGGIGDEARDMLAERQVGLIFWLRSILEKIGLRRTVSKVVLTGGSARWFFVGEAAKENFPAALCVHSARGYEDIAFGLALFPLLTASHDRVQRLLNDKLDKFAGKAVRMARSLLEKNSAVIVRMCADRIVMRDVMPPLEAAREKSMTAAELERAFSENIENDPELPAIVKEKSDLLREEIQEQLNLAFREWLRENGVLLVPRFVFPAQAIGQDFFDNVSVKISRLDSLNLMRFTLTTIVPILAGTAAAGAIAHAGEPVSAIVGGGLAMGATWFLAKTAPSFMENRKLPAFFLNEKNRKKIIDKNREYIEKALKDSMREVEDKMSADIERRLRSALVSMLNRLTLLNQVRISQAES